MTEVIANCKQEDSGVLAFSLRPLTRAFWVFGFDMLTPPDQRSVVKLVLRILLRIPPLLLAFYAASICMACVNQMLNAKINFRTFRSECVPVALRTNAADMAFAAVCFVVLTVHEKRLAAIFGVKAKTGFEDLGLQSNQKPVQIRMRWALVLAILSFLFALVATFGLVDLYKFPAMLFGAFNGRFLHYNCVLPLRILSTLFCCLYAMLCFNLRAGLRLLAGSTPGHASVDQLEGRYDRMRRLVNDVDDVFSSGLPLLFLCRFLSMGVWIEFGLTRPGITELPKFLAVMMHALQGFCLIVPPILVNQAAKKAFDIELPDEKRSFHGGIYSSHESSSRASARVNFAMMRMATDPPRMTAGGYPITSWILVVAIIISWLYLALSWLEVVIKDGLTNIEPQTNTTSVTLFAENSSVTSKTRRDRLPFTTTTRRTPSFPTANFNLINNGTTIKADGNIPD